MCAFIRSSASPIYNDPAATCHPNRPTRCLTPVYSMVTIPNAVRMFRGGEVESHVPQSRLIDEMLFDVKVCADVERFICHKTVLAST